MWSLELSGPDPKAHPLSRPEGSAKLRRMSAHSNTPPELPEITDEAGDTPSWVPRLGLVLALLFVAWVVLQHGHAGGEAGLPEASAAGN